MLFSLLTTSAILALSTYNYHKASQAAVTLSRTIVEHLRERVVQEVSDYLWSLETATLLAGQQFRSYDLATSAETWFTLTDQPLFTSLNLSNLYIADHQGNFLATGYREGQREERQLRVTYDSTEKNDIRRLRDATHVNKEQRYSDYDPRLRQWFINTNAFEKPQWSAMYHDFETGQLSSTFSAPVINPTTGAVEKVVAADILLERATALLHTLSLGFDGDIVIMNHDNSVIGATTLRNDTHTGDTPFATVQLPAPIAQAVQEISNESMIAPFTVGDDTFLRAVAPLRPGLHAKWRVVVILPESVILRDAKQALIESILGSIVVLVIALILVRTFANAIARPILRLAGNATAITQLNFHETNPNGSVISEIATLQQSLETMKKSLINFSRYLPLLMVQQLVSAGKLATIGGERRTLTLFFSDIANFTTISETTPPEELLKQLCEYFALISAIIERHGGLIDKFIGDSVMAFWGAPNTCPNGAQSASLAALEIQKELTQQNAVWEHQGLAPFITRIGIHTGDCLVGNIGAPERMNYTVLGDAVNIASRLEGLNKEFGSAILISQATYDALTAKLPVIAHGSHYVKGRSEPLDIYELTVPSSPATTP
ncbi:adenylate/guanylate cyclase domain-containing protein [Chrysiogenes arsenatis]|uniref:adenylate/guanylate cyclase domain-containing protein n=1 Tax=Chrysiogenes arsenatis TaxID=309797 RepID=UPI00135F1A04|nr:adenylate/guanylate cyclase domain-containing protein [Chrysiogenes arsenatis]